MYAPNKLQPAKFGKHLGMGSVDPDETLTRAQVNQGSRIILIL
jgi:hypothetical protein